MSHRRVDIDSPRQSLPLAAQGRFDRTLFGFGLFAAVNLFLCGTYLLCGAFFDPLGATEVAAVVAGFALALASFLLIFLVWSRAKEILARRQEEHRQALYAKGPVITIYGQTVQDTLNTETRLNDRKNLPGADVNLLPADQACAAKAGK